MIKTQQYNNIKYHLERKTKFDDLLYHGLNPSLFCFFFFIRYDEGNILYSEAR
jgi:hypothetical protein